MRDFDFDELDRAVTSAINRSNTSKKPAPAPQANTSAATMATPAETPRPVTNEPSAASQSLTSRPTSARAVHSRVSPSEVASRLQFAKPAPSSDDTSDKPAASVVTTVTPAPALRRRRIPHKEGVYMDMVAKPKRTHGTTLKPLSTASDLATPAPAPAPVTPEPATMAPAPGLAAAMEALLADEQGDKPQTLAPKPTEAPKAFAPEPIETPEPVAFSPFLTGTKIEKRPLGARAAADNALAEPQEPETSEPAPQSDEPEIHQDLVAIESGSHIPAEDLETESPAPIEDDHSAVEIVTPTPTPETEAPERETSAPTPTGPTSIARQYKAPQKVASEDDETGAIFDPQTYAQPIESDHTKAKHFPWMWVVIVLVSLLIGVAAGAMAWLEGFTVPL